MKEKIAIDGCNAHQYWLMLKQLREGRSEIAKMLRHGLLQLSAPGFYQGVMDIGEVDALADEIERELELYRRRKPKHRRPFFMYFKLDKMVVSSRNIASIRNYIAVLQGNRDYIRGKIRRYPMEVMASGLYFLFSDTREIDWVIGELKRKVRAAEERMSKPWWERMLALGA